MIKKLVYTIFFCSILFVSCKNDSAVSKVKKENVEKAVAKISNYEGPAVISFDKEVFEFGTVNEGDIVEHSFIITNSGKSDLIIADAKASCGCTIPDWPKHAIKPGESASLGIKFNTLGKPNKQSKTITLTTNTVNGKETVRVSGMVIPKTKN